MAVEWVIGGLVAFGVVLASIIWYLLDSRERRVTAMFKARVEELKASVNPTNEIMVTYGKLNQELNAMLRQQIAANSDVMAAMLSVAKQVAGIRGGQTVTIPAVFTPATGHEDENSLHAPSVSADDMLN